MRPVGSELCVNAMGTATFSNASGSARILSPTPRKRCSSIIVERASSSPAGGAPGFARIS